MIECARRQSGGWLDQRSTTSVLFQRRLSNYTLDLDGLGEIEWEVYQESVGQYYLKFNPRLMPHGAVFTDEEQSYLLFINQTFFPPF